MSLSPEVFGHVDTEANTGESGGNKQQNVRRCSRSAKADLQFPVGRVHRHLKKGRYAKRIGVGASGEIQTQAALPHLLSS
jgi:hypothetical protein